MNKIVRLIESFLTYQGEGQDVGKYMYLLRYKNCNRKCNYCDTQVKMRVSGEYDMDLRDIQKIVSEKNCGIMITGGEPTFGLNLKYTENIINGVDCYLFNVETNGFKLDELISKINPNKNVKYILSPKLFELMDVDFYEDLLSKVKDNEKVFIKLVFEPDNRHIDYFLENSIKSFDKHKIFLMPEGATRDELLLHMGPVLDAAEKFGVNITSREHIMYNFI